MLLIKNGYVIDPRSKQEGYFDVLIDGERIVKLEEGLAENLASDPSLLAGIQVVDAKDSVVAPGLVDIHVHFRDPGFTYKEDMESGANSAAKGGYTTVVLMANTKPVIDNEETLSYVIDKAKESKIHIETCATITKGMQGKELTDFKTLYEKGAVGFTDDGMPILESEVLRAALLQAKEMGVPLSVHEEDPKYIGNNGINRHIARKELGLEGSPRMAEIAIVERDLQIAMETGGLFNIQHISTKEAVELVRKAKKRAEGIHAEVTPHHFTLTEDAVITHGTLAKMNPPLRREEDRKALIVGLQDGTIDIIATDHAPHSQEEKEKPLIEAPSGIIGLETALSLGLTHLVQPEYLSILQLLEKMSYHPAKLYGLEAGYIEEGGPADLVVFAPKEEWIVDAYESKSSNTPFTGETLKGVVKYTICSGEIVYQRDE